MNPETEGGTDLRSGRDRRRTHRYDTAFNIKIRFTPDGSPIDGSSIELGPNGLRLRTLIPLSEAAYIHVTFENASNNTHCEGRVVWTERSKKGNGYESGIDIQRWGGDVPQTDLIQPGKARLKKDRRSRR